MNNLITHNVYVCRNSDHTYKKFEVLEVTETTYHILNADTNESFRSKKEVFHHKWEVVEVLGTSISYYLN